MEKQRVAIIGAGEIGRAIGGILKSKNIQLEIWDKTPGRIPGQKPLVDIIPWADFIFLCVPSWAIKEIASDIRNILKRGVVVVSLAKGIEAETQKTVDEILEEILPKTHFALLSGPMIAEELSVGKEGVGVVGAKDEKTFDKVKKLFKNTNLGVEYANDVRGVALAGALKNIYAIGLGIIDVLGLGENFKGWFIEEAVKEMSEIIGILGGKKETAYTAAGLGDLITTGYSLNSRNRQAGEDLIKTGKCCLKSEGMTSFPSLDALLGNKLEKFKLLSALQAVIMQNKKAKMIFGGLL